MKSGKTQMIINLWFSFGWAHQKRMRVQDIGLLERKRLGKLAEDIQRMELLIGNVGFTPELLIPNGKMIGIFLKIIDHKISFTLDTLGAMPQNAT